MRIIALLLMVTLPALATAQARVTGYITEQTIAGVQLRDTTEGTTYGLLLNGPSAYTTKTVRTSSGGTLELRIYKVPNDGQLVRFRTFGTSATTLLDDANIQVSHWKDYFDEEFQTVAIEAIGDMTTQERTFFIASLRAMVKATIQAAVDEELARFEGTVEQIEARRPR